MIDANTIVRERQCAIRREIDRRGIALKAVAFDSGIPLATLTSYFPLEGGREPATVPGSAIYALAAGDALPLDLLSLLMPEGLLIVRCPEAVDHDEASKCMQNYLRCKDEAHHPESEAGRDIGPGEHATLVRHLTIVGKVA